MGNSYPHSRKKVARLYSRWAAVFDACCAVLGQCSVLRKRQAMETATGTSLDTWLRCVESPGFGGWTADRVQALMDFEIAHIGDNTIQRAWNGEDIQPEAEKTVETAADQALLSAINLAREIAEKKPDGLDRAELRALCKILPDVIADLAGFHREAKAELMKGGAR